MRIFNHIKFDDLLEMQKYALEELQRFLFEMGKPIGKYSVYKDKLIAICLCQGAAQHYVDTLNIYEFDKIIPIENTEIQARKLRINKYGKVLYGINDIDIWYFFEEDDVIKIPNRGNCKKTTKKLFTNLGERRIDFMKKALDIKNFNRTEINNLEKYLLNYLSNAKTQTAKLLSLKSVIGLYPDNILGEIIWKVKRSNPQFTRRRKREA